MSLPIGSIIMWKNDLASVPDGWHLCDGSTYDGKVTPDLRGHFIYGASADGDVGTNSNGAHTHARPANTGAGGYHRHAASIGVSGTGNNTAVRDGAGTSAADAGHSHDGVSGFTGYDTADHTHTVGGDTLSSANEPAYLMLYFIMRTI